MEIKIERLDASLKRDLLIFIKCQWNFYRNDPNFVPPIISDRLHLLDIKKNPFYKHAKMQLFIARQNDSIIGRIAAITNEEHNKTHSDNIGFFGFFECIDNNEVSKLLFSEAENWLKSQGKTAIRGPVNPSMNDEVALLSEGFDLPPILLMNYNPRYYEKLILDAGLNQCKELYAYRVTAEGFASDKLTRLQAVVCERNGIEIRQVDFKNKENFKRDIETVKKIYNEAWVPNWGFVKLTDEEFDYFVADFKKIADPRLAIIAYIRGRIAGMTLALPNINEFLIHNKSGSLLGAGYHLLTKKKKIQYMRIIILGVLPEFQKTGVDSVLYYEIGKRGGAAGFKFGEASWILEDNTMMNRGLTQTMNGELYKKYKLYEKLL